MNKIYERMAKLISEVGKFDVRPGGYSTDPQQATRDRNELIRSRRKGTLGNPTARTELARKVKIARKPASWITSLEGPDRGQIVPGTRENDPRGVLKPGQVGSWTNLGRKELKRGRERTDTSTEETGMNKIYERIAQLMIEASPDIATSHGHYEDLKAYMRHHHPALNHPNTEEGIAKAGTIPHSKFVGFRGRKGKSKK